MLNSVDLTQLPKKEHRAKLGTGIALVFQDSATALNPVVPIGRQITEGMRFHLHLSRGEARDRAIELLTQVGISDPVERLNHYPHQLSGGMRQRVTIAIALACEPDVLIADEATTALDVTVQKQILDLLQQLQQEHHMAMMIITHDLGVVAGRTDEIAVMYAGQLVEHGPTRVLFKEHRHQYTAALLRSTPNLDQEPHSELTTIPGIPPRLADLPVGCRFAPRCAAATRECEAQDPALVADSPGHEYKCIWPVRETGGQSLAAESPSSGGGA
jgi:peptide/nickel transport system ATP-binding protein